MRQDKRNDTTLTTELRKEIPPRGKGKRSLMLAAIREVCVGGEQEFLEGVVRAAIGNFETPANMLLMNMVLQRIEPPLKTTMPPVNFEFTEGAEPHIQAAQVMKATAQGLIPPDIANMFVNSIANMIRIDEVTRIAAKLEEIEKSLGLSNE